MKKNLRYKLLICIIIGFIVYQIAPLIGGYRFTAMQAVNASNLLPKNSKIFGVVKRDWSTVYLLNTSNGIKTALTEKKGLLWRCQSITYFFDDIIKNDEVKTVGWENLTDVNNKQITVYAVQTTDPRVKFIEAGSDLNRIRKPITLNEIVIFSWDVAIPCNDINAIASDKSNIQLYKDEFPTNTNNINSKDFRWYPVNS